MLRTSCILLFAFSYLLCPAYASLPVRVVLVGNANSTTSSGLIGIIVGGIIIVVLLSAIGLFWWKTSSSYSSPDHSFPKLTLKDLGILTSYLSPTKFNGANLNVQTFSLNGITRGIVLQSSSVNIYLSLQEVLFFNSLSSQYSNTVLTVPARAITTNSRKPPYIYSITDVDGAFYLISKIGKEFAVTSSTAGSVGLSYTVSGSQRNIDPNQATKLVNPETAFPSMSLDWVSILNNIQSALTSGKTLSTQEALAFVFSANPPKFNYKSKAITFLPYYIAQKAPAFDFANDNTHIYVGVNEIINFYFISRLLVSDFASTLKDSSGNSLLGDGNEIDNIILVVPSRSMSKNILIDKPSVGHQFKFNNGSSPNDPVQIIDLSNQNIDRSIIVITRVDGKTFRMDANGESGVMIPYVLTLMFGE